MSLSGESLAYFVEKTVGNCVNSFPSVSQESCVDTTHVWLWKFARAIKTKESRYKQKVKFWISSWFLQFVMHNEDGHCILLASFPEHLYCRLCLSWGWKKKNRSSVKKKDRNMWVRESLAAFNDDCMKLWQQIFACFFSQWNAIKLFSNLDITGRYTAHPLCIMISYSYPSLHCGSFDFLYKLE